MIARLFWLFSTCVDWNTIPWGVYCQMYPDLRWCVMENCWGVIVKMLMTSYTHSHRWFKCRHDLLSHICSHGVFMVKFARSSTCVEMNDYLMSQFCCSFHSQTLLLAMLSDSVLASIYHNYWLGVQDISYMVVHFIIHPTARYTLRLRCPLRS